MSSYLEHFIESMAFVCQFLKMQLTRDFFRYPTTATGPKSKPFLGKSVGY